MENLLGLFKYHCHYLFKKQYSKNDKAIELKSDEKDYSNVDFGENVGDRISSENLRTITRKMYYQNIKVIKNF